MKVICQRWFIGVTAGVVVATLRMFAQEGQRPVFRVKVDMVVLSFTVTDSKGHYVNGLKPGDFRILEDGIVQKISTFGEGSKPPVAVLEDGSTRPLIGAGTGDGSFKPGLDPRADAFAGTNVFILFDTSNYMYRDVSRFCLCLGRDCRFHPRLGPRRLHRRLYVQPQYFSRGFTHP